MRLSSSPNAVVSVLKTALATWTLTLTVVAEGLTSFPRVTQGAYLQMATPASMVVRWRTAFPTTSLVRYGTAPGSLPYQAGSPGRVRDHVVLVSGLSPGTRYYYSVGSSNKVLQSGPGNYFQTSPLPGSVQPVRVWVIGDPGTDYPEQKAVRDSYERWNGGRDTSLVLALGDNAYSRGTDAQYGRAFFGVYRELFKHAAVWPTLGNHDARSADSATESGAYYHLFTLPRQGQAGGVPSGTAAYYAFDYANAHFICLNSQDLDLSTNGAMVTWLRRDLAANRLPWTIAFWHHPPYTKGSHDSDSATANPDDQHMGQMRERIVPVLEDGGVDLVLCGHSHLYERSYPLRGHYGRAASLKPAMILDRGSGRFEAGEAYHSSSDPARHGIVFVNAGNAGHATRPKDLHGLNHPAMFVSLNIPGSVVLDLLGGRLDATLLDQKGRLRDEFTVLKDSK